MENAGEGCRESERGRGERERERDKRKKGDDASNVSAFARAACVAIESSSGKMAAKGKTKR